MGLTSKHSFGRLLPKFQTPSFHAGDKKYKIGFGSWKKPIRRDYRKNPEYSSEENSGRTLWEMTHPQNSAYRPVLTSWYPRAVSGGRYHG